MCTVTSLQAEAACKRHSRLEGPAHLRHREAGEQALEEAPLEEPGQPPAQLALRRAWRADEEDVLPCQGCQQH